MEALLALSHLYGVPINALLEEPNRLASLLDIPADADGVVYATDKEELPRNRAWAETIRRDGWVRRNMETPRDTDGILATVGRTIAAHGGTILEIGVGPGGGFMPYILDADPDATLILSDLSPTVVREWKTYLDAHHPAPHLSYCVCNFCSLPFPDASVDVISDGGGIGNCEDGTKAAALREAYRVLKPGGMLVTSTGFVNKTSAASLPADVLAVLRERRADIFEDLYEETVLAGFSKIDSVISGTWNTDHDDSGIADLARTLGVNLTFTAYVRFCYKQ